MLIIVKRKMSMIVGEGYTENKKVVGGKEEEEEEEKEERKERKLVLLYVATMACGNG